MSPYPVRFSLGYEKREIKREPANLTVPPKISNGSVGLTDVGESTFD